MTAETWAFDTDDYVRITEVRINFMERLLVDLIPSYSLDTTLDVGCGVGYFSRRLADLGLTVRALDSRPQNIEEARRRNPDIPFWVQDIEQPLASGIGSFDLVLCFGLLYHLENPFSAIRNLFTLTTKMLFIESRVIPGHELAASLFEETESHDQSLNYVALIPSESSFVKMLYCAGFPYVYRTDRLPDHDDFRETPISRKKRTVLVAAKTHLTHNFLELLPEPASRDPWLKQSNSKAGRLSKFLRKPGQEKLLSIQVKVKQLWNRLFQSLLLPVRLPYGGWWLGALDSCRDAIVEGRFEEAEWRFVKKFLKKGMTVLDIGAHHGFYTLLAAKEVGVEGHVIAFEPSPRERSRLSTNLRLNHCSKVKIEPFALSDQDGEAPFFVVDGRQTMFNSLRPPAGPAPINRITVKTVALDSYVEKEQIERIDFVKIDAEGAELDILTGAQVSLGQRFRPLIMIEASDLRTSQWGYATSNILEALSGLRYRWFTMGPEGLLEPYHNGTPRYNFIAVPAEKLGTLQELIEPAGNA
jgi:FkbM family methyltransferase